MRQIINILTILAFAVGFGLTKPAQAAPGDFPVQYMVKFVCGFVQPPEPGTVPPPVKPGNYATAINVHNYTRTDYLSSRRVALHYRAGGPLPPAPPPRNAFIFRFRVLEIDCIDIWAMVGVPPETFVKGMVHIGTPIPLPVAAVYTSQTDLDPIPPPDAGAGISIDVEQIPPFINVSQPTGG